MIRHACLRRLVAQLRARPHVERWRWWGLWEVRHVVAVERFGPIGDLDLMVPWGRA